MNDLHNNTRTKTVIAPVAIGANATKTGKIIDRQGYGGVEFIAAYGAVTTTGTIVTLVCKEGDVTGTLTSVADADLLGTEALASLLAATPRTSGSTSNVTKRLGYKGNKRYVQVNAVQTGVTSVGCVGITALLHSPGNAPTDNP
ncbi:MAG: hypothetical protein IPK39_23120 [Sulfuritalea sp.]|nr:hypothetical protein [Sulfuritalea sp.]